MAFYERFRSYSILENLKKRMTIPYYEGQIYPDAFTFYPTQGIIHVISNAGTSGYLSDTFDNLELGDVVEVSCEMLSLSGTMPRISFDEYNSVGGNPNDYTGTEFTQLINRGQWETFKTRYVVRDLKGTKKIRCVIGLWTADSGEYQMRNLRISVKTKKNIENEQLQVNPPLEFKPFAIRKLNGYWQIRDDFANGGATLSGGSDNTTIVINFSKPFQKRPVATVGGDYYKSSSKYIPKVSNAQKASAEIRLFDALTNVAKPLSDVEEETHFMVNFIG